MYSHYKKKMVLIGFLPMFVRIREGARKRFRRLRCSTARAFHSRPLC